MADMKLLNRKVLMAAVLVASAPLAMAQQDRSVKEPRPAAERSGEASRGAGSIRASEARERQVFRRLDTNGDGYLSDAELDARRAERAEWIALDRDRDGRISPKEFAAIADR